MLTLPNYQIGTQIYESANSLVYRGVRKKDNQPVILKMLKEDYPTPAELTRYRQEYEIIHDLDLAGVINAYGIEKCQNTLVIIFQDLGGESLKQLMATRPLTLNEFLPLAIQITDSLGNIHAANLIHKDINPSNIVVNPETKQLKIIDFGIASRLPRENPTLKTPEQLEGTLAYISPEQTGRINRSLDYRTDLYSLGVTFYELLTGVVPFAATDAMELVHCHLAKTPTPLCEFNSDIPLIVSDIILKLLAKNAEDRYQSAFGVKADLENCLALSKKVFGNKLFSTQFQLAQNDFSGKLQIPQKLYGRDNEVNILLQAFERVSFKKAEMILVAGYSGVGKTALVRSVHKPMTEKRGYFAAGKFDQFQKNIPYSAITQAFNEFCRYLLMENTETLANWQSQILDAVGNNGQIIIDVVPDLELVIGTQPEVAKIGPTETQNRFQMFFLNFVKALCDKDHPFILFIDDLQWVDLASLGLLKSIMLDDEIQHLLIIVAYRDNEVDGSHPFIMATSELQKANATINTIFLANLLGGDINQLLQESLKCEAGRTQPLTDLIFQKTQGNAFFTHQFLQTLYFEALLRFDFEQHQWQWDVDRIAAQNITANVVDLMANKIDKLPSKTSKVLQFAACIGNQFDLSILAIIYEQNQNETLSILRPAIAEGLIQPLDENYKHIESFEKSQFKFLHDRVQQAAYSLIAEPSKKSIHLQIGRLLLANTSQAELEKHLFDIVNQLNAGRELIDEPTEQQQLAELNLKAGQKAKNATAYVASQQYVVAGISLLSQDSWQHHYSLTFALHKEQAEVAYLNGHFEDAEKWIHAIFPKAQTTLEKVELYYLLITQYVHLAQSESALLIGKKVFDLLGLHWPTDENVQIALDIEVTELQKKMGEQDITRLLEQPGTNNSEAKIVVHLVLKLTEAAYFAGLETLISFLFAKVASLSLKYGPVPESSLGYLSYGMVLSFSGDYHSGYEFGLLALKLSKKFNNLSYQCIICENIVGNINYLVNPLKSADPIFQEGYQAGLESGTFTQTSYLILHHIYSLFYRGEPIEPLLIKLRSFKSFVQTNQLQLAVNSLLGLELVLCNLNGNNKSIFQTLDEEQYIKSCQEDFASTSLFYILKAQIFYGYDNPEKGLQCALEAEKLISYLAGLLPETAHNFYYSLNLIACYPTKADHEQEQYWGQLEINQKQMKTWANNCPENFLHQYLLVEAEMARLAGKELEAMELYDRAIASAKDNEFTQIEALANELAAKFWLGKGQEKFAKLYFTDALYGYQQWGALAIVTDLEAKYPQLLITPKSLRADVTTTVTLMSSSVSQLQTSTVLDLDSVTKASQTLAGEIVLSKLLEKMMHIVIENAGAERGLLILEKEKAKSEWVIEASAVLGVDEMTILQSIPLDGHLPTSVVNYVVRTREPVVLANAMQEGIYSEDSYIRQQKLKSVLCSPILHQRQLIGVLYLENNLTEGAFTPARFKIIDMLSSQAAISLENALLYRTLEQKVEERTAQLAQANKEIIVLNEQLKQENLRMSAELEVAKHLQQMVLPKEVELQQIESLDIAGFMEPADEVGGDYYEVLSHDGNIKIGIGDVTGHGLESGVVMLMVQTTVRALLLAGINNPETFLNVVNRTIYHNAQRMETDKNLTLSLLDYQTGTLTITGQHEEVLLVRKGGEIERIDTFDLGFMIGVENDISEFASHRKISLQPGDGIVLYTDGITEARNPNKKLYGVERLCEVVSRNWHLSAQEIQQAIVADVKQYIDTQKVFDDITLLVLKQK